MHFFTNKNPFIKRLGECLGKGAFGSVYKAFNWNTGEAVAVKQIKLIDLPKSELRMIEVGCIAGCASMSCRLILTTYPTICRAKSTSSRIST